MTAELIASLNALADKWEGRIDIGYDDYLGGEKSAFDEAATDLRELIEGLSRHVVSAMDEKRAREVLGNAIQPDGGLFNSGQYMAWNPVNKDICLDADFTLEEVEAIAWWMRAHQVTG